MTEQKGTPGGPQCHLVKKQDFTENVESCFFVTKTKIALDKVEKLCGPFANMHWQMGPCS